MNFEARVIDAQQRMRSVSVEALDADDAQRQLRDQHLRTLSLKPGRQPGSPWLVGRAGQRAFPLLLFAQELLALLDAGLSVIEAVEALLDKEPAAGVRAVLMRLQAHLRTGLSLSQALRLQGDVFPALFVGMVQAAEGTSNLHDALARYVDYRTRLDAVRGKIISASIYPVILLVVGVGVTLFLLGYVVPRFATVYQSSGRELPWASQLLLGWGHFVSAHAQALGAGALAVLGGAGALVLVACPGRWFRQWVLRWPWVGDRLRLLELSRLYLTLGLLLEGGLPITQALNLVQSVGSDVTKAKLGRVRQAVMQGEVLSHALEREALSTPVAGRLLRVGEASGQLGAMLRRAALFYETETGRWIERFTRAFEPLLMAAIGLVIGLIVLLLYMPIFDLAGSLQ